MSALVAASALGACAPDAAAQADSAYTQGAGFRLAQTDHGEVRFRVYSYVRYLTQAGLEPVFVDSFGDTAEVRDRHDVQVNKVNIAFQGWALDPKLRYLFYIWTNNPAQGLPAQVSVSGYLTYQVGSYLTVGGGISALPGVRSTEGNFPYWLTLDNRTIADEYFRPSYTQGFWATGELVSGLRYDAMVGNNLSQLGVDAGQLDDGFNTLSAALAWYPTTGEFGHREQFGDFEQHDEVATRLAIHFTRSPENRQTQPSTDGFDNVQLRLSDGNVIFRQDLFGPGIRLDSATYHMASADAGVKYRGLSLDAEYYRRWIDGFHGQHTETLPFDELRDQGFQLLASSMLLPLTLQLYALTSKVFGEYGDPWEVRAGLNFFPWENQVARLNLELMHLDRSPVGGLSLPYLVGASGQIAHFNVQLDF